jgi:plastocyanin
MEVTGIDSLLESRESGRHFAPENQRTWNPSLNSRADSLRRRKTMTSPFLKLGFGVACFLFAGLMVHDGHPVPAQVVALDECDPATFNAANAVGPDFCKNVALGASTQFSTLFAEAQAGNPDPKWDFEPDTLTVNEGTPIIAVDEGGEPHTFTEVARFGGGFIGGLNGPNETTAPECAGGFSTVEVARTRVLQGSQLQVAGLSKGEHFFQCCIHPWMRVKIEVR